jgi:predicted GTPase
MNFLDRFLQSFEEGLKKANPTASSQQLDSVRDELRRRVALEPPPKIAIVGEAGVGKSSTLNALFNAGVPVSDTRACTKRDIELTIDLSHDSRVPRQLIVYDMPGLGESIQADQYNIEVYERVLPIVDVFVWILDAQNRAIRGVQERLRDDIAPRIPNAVDKLVFALNKVDLVSPGQDAWNPHFNIPSEEQQRNIEGREADVREKIAEVLPAWHGLTIAYSAVKRYRLSTLFRGMLEAVPETRRWVLGDRMDLASYEDLIDKNVLEAVRNDPSRFRPGDPRARGPEDRRRS